MKDFRHGAFSSKRLEEHAKAADVTNRAREATNAAVGQAKDRLGTPGAGGERV